VAFLLLVFPLHAEEPLVVSGEQIELGKGLSVLEDRSGKLTFDEVRDPSRSGAFVRSRRSIPNYGFSDSVFWVRFSVTNRSGIDDWFLNVAYPPLDSIVLYEKDGEGKWIKRETGDKFRFSHREIDHREFLFPIRLVPGETRQFYFRFESQGSNQFPLYLVSQRTLYEQDRDESLLFGIYYGIVIILALYNFVLFFVLKEPGFIYYFLYITGYGIVMLILNGFAYQFLWPDSPWLENRSLPFFIGWAFFWSLQFARDFLETKMASPRIDTMMVVLTGLMGVLIGLAFFARYSFTISLAASLVSGFAILVFIATLVRLKQGYRPARYFMIAWLIFLFGVLIYSLKGFGIFPSNFLTDNGLQIGSALEMGLLSFALGEKMRNMNEESRRAHLLVVENEKRLQEVELKSTRLEIELLKKNIEPHFMLNSINATVVWLEEDPSTAAVLMRALADELRILLSVSGEKVIPLCQEIELCQSHLKVMGLRHDRSFEFIREGLDGTETIPPLIFHTLIENGITHGMKGKREGMFRLEKEILQSGETRYVFTDNGTPDPSGGKGKTGLGFRFIRTRLEEVYPGRWQLAAGPTEKGWRVAITIAANGAGVSI